MFTLFSQTLLHELVRLDLSYNNIKEIGHLEVGITTFGQLFGMTLTIIRAAERGEGGGQLAPDPKQVGAPNLKNILKLNKPHQNRGEYKALTAAFKGIKGSV